MEKEAIKYETREQVKVVTLAVGQLADSTITQRIQLEDDFDFCDGVQVIQTKNANLHPFNIGISDKENVYLDVTPGVTFQTSTSVDPNKRFKELFQPIRSGIDTQIKINTPDQIGAVVELYFVFRIRRLIKE